MAVCGESRTWTAAGACCQQHAASHMLCPGPTCAGSLSRDRNWCVQHTDSNCPLDCCCMSGITAAVLIFRADQVAPGSKPGSNNIKATCTLNACLFSARVYMFQAVVVLREFCWFCCRWGCLRRPSLPVLGALRCVPLGVGVILDWIHFLSPAPAGSWLPACCLSSRSHAACRESHTAV